MSSRPRKPHCATWRCSWPAVRRHGDLRRRRGTGRADLRPPVGRRHAVRLVRVVRGGRDVGRAPVLGRQPLAARRPEHIRGRAPHRSPRGNPRLLRAPRHRRAGRPAGRNRRRDRRADRRRRSDVGCDRRPRDSRGADSGRSRDAVERLHGARRHGDLERGRARVPGAAGRRAGLPTASGDARRA